MSHPALHGLDLCWSSLQSLLDELSADQWSTQSLCPDWDVAGVVMHLVAVEEMLLGRPPSEFAERLPFDELAGFTEAMSKLTHSELAEKFRTVTAARKAELAAMSDEDFATPVMTPVGPGTYGRFMDIRVFDFWVHEQDIRTPLGLPGHEDGAATSLSQIRGTGAIAHLSDIVIGLERNGQAENATERNTTRIRVLKNRFSGITGPAGSLLYSHETGRMKEVDDTL